VERQPETRSEPIVKRVNWFISDRGGAIANTTQQFLIKDNRDVADGVYTCCGGLSFSPNGSLSLGSFEPAVYQPYLAADITFMPTFGGDFLPLAAWERRHESAKAILAWVLAHNFTGVHNDWESTGDGGVDAYKFYEFWEVVADELHPHGKRVGACIETSPANVSHPWPEVVLANDTSWHSYMFNWDYPLAIKYMDVLTNMATYPMMHTADGNNSWCKGFPNSTFCFFGVRDYVDHLTPAFKYLEQTECDKNRHTEAKWCGLKGQVQNMLDAGVDAASGQLSPGLWMNHCHISPEFPGGVTAQGWTAGRKHRCARFSSTSTRSVSARSTFGTRSSRQRTWPRVPGLCRSCGVGAFDDHWVLR
jgi:hypothetical protein